MGIVELMGADVWISSNIITYGTLATEEITERIRSEIESYWNDARGLIYLEGRERQVRFRILAECLPLLSARQVETNSDPLNNFIRIEDYSPVHISFVDGLGCNSGYFLIDNLYVGSTTAAHEYGHTLGLDHPLNMDYRGQGTPSIMYPRGTLVDPAFQYDPAVPAGTKGGTMHPMYRKVKQADIERLRLNQLPFIYGKSVLGSFSNRWHNRYQPPIEHL